MERIDGAQAAPANAPGGDNRGQGEPGFGSTLGSGIAFVDLNGDGIKDLVAGAPYQNTGTTKDRVGSITIEYGNVQNMTLPFTAGDDVLSGTAGVDRISGGAGNDVINNIGANDVAYGGQGNDLIAITSIDFLRVDGNEGINTLRLDGTSSMKLDISDLGMKVQNFSIIDMVADDNVGHEVVLRLSDVINLNGNGHTTDGFQALRILGGSSDSLNLSDTSYTVSNDVHEENGVSFVVLKHEPKNIDVWVGNSFADIWVQNGIDLTLPVI